MYDSLSLEGEQCAILHSENADVYARVLVDLLGDGPYGFGRRISNAGITHLMTPDNLSNKTKR